MWAGLIAVSIVCAASFSHRKAQALNAAGAAQEMHVAARTGDVASISAAGRGGPSIRLTDGRDVLADYQGDPALVQSLAQAEPLGLASADFDEDGVPDLVGGYRDGTGGGLVTVLRGDVDALYPNSPDAQRRRAGGARDDAPFLSPARVFAAPLPFDYIGAGDFNGDGHRDVVGASRGRRALFMLAGDGKGNLSAAREMALPGAVTALTVGEVNRPDGLADVIVGVEGAEGPRALVYEGPRGAFKASPEVFKMPARVSALALAQLDEGYAFDLAVAAGDQLVFVRGRDRKLSARREGDDPAPEAGVTRRSFGSAISSLAVGDFDGGPQTELALLLADGSIQVLGGGARPARPQGTKRGVAGWRSEVVSEPGRWAGATRLVSAKVSSSKGDDLLLLDAAARQVRVLKGRRASKSRVEPLFEIEGAAGDLAALEVGDGAPVAVLPMQLNVDALTDLVVLRQGTSAPAVVLTASNTEERAIKATGRISQTNFGSGARLGATPTSTGYPKNIPPRSKPGTTAAPTRQREVKQKTKQGGGSITPLGACPTTSPIAVGQTINGALATSDCFLQDGNYFDEYTFSGTAGQQIAVEMNSGEFDTFLYLLAPDGSLLETDDDSGGGTDSRIPSDGGFFSLPAAGTYTIYATSFEAEETGAYALTLSAPGGGQCPSTPLTSGQIFSGALSSTDCFFDSGARIGAFVDIYTFNGRAGQEAIVEMASTTIDSYLILIAPDESTLEDDDSGEGLDARIPPSGTVVLPANGTYTVYATSSFANETGTYQVRVTLGPPPVVSTVVTNTNDSGAGSLRQAILNANSNVGVDTVSFNIPGSGVRTINLISALPEITDPVVIDGYTQPGASPNTLPSGSNATLLIELNGQATPPGTSGLQIDAGSSRVRGLVINRFGVADCGSTADISQGHGIVLSSAGGNIIEGNYLGTNAGGSGAQCNSGLGVFAFNSSNNVIGGTTSAARNLVSGNNINGIQIGGDFSVGNQVQGNYVGTNASGNADLGNGGNGMQVINGTGHVVGGTTAGAGNLVSGNGSPGVALGFSDPSGILVQANFIGTNAAGAAAIPNEGGGIIVGGFFQIDGSPITATDNTIGGAVPGAGNLVSGNNGNGVEVINTGSQDNLVQGNFIGTNAAGAAAVPNQGSGVFITNAPNNVIGIDDEFDELMVDGANLISGNRDYGVGVGILRQNEANPGQFITGGDRMLVVLNVIGTDINLNPLGNGLDGVFVDADSVNNRIRFNIIAFNGGNGIRIPDNGSRSGFQINLETNLIYSNNGIGIDLGPTGVTPNDPGDLDGGANLLQNFPDLTPPPAGPVSVTAADRDPKEAATTVNGTLSTTAQANQTYTVHWYFSADQQCSSNEASSLPLANGRVPNVTTDANGRAAFSFPLEFPAGVARGVVNCTATDATGNTSEFSSCIPVTQAAAPPSVQFSAAAFSAGEGDARATITLTRSGDTSGPLSVSYATVDNPAAVPCSPTLTTERGIAYARCDYATSIDTLSFAANETQKTLTIPLIDDAHVEGNETFTVTLSNPSTGAALGAQVSAVVTIADNDTNPNAANPVYASREFFVRQQYLDFLSREPDTGGFNAWLGVLNGCPNADVGPEVPSQCDRIFVSGIGFFDSQEFRLKGLYVFLFYRVSFDRLAQYTEIAPDLRAVTGQTPQDTFNKRAQFADAFAARAEFVNQYGGMTNQQYVDTLLGRYNLPQITTEDPANPEGTAQVTLARADLVNRLNGVGGALTRAQVLRAIVQSDEVGAAERNRAFVAIQYYGYLRRTPEEPGYSANVNFLNQNPAGFREIINAFLNSREYQLRFGRIER